MEEHRHDIAIIGGGPSGLACGIAGVRAGLDVIVLEQGSIVEAIRRFPTNLVWFSTPELLEIGEVPFVIPTLRPTRADTIRYYQRVSAHYNLDIRPFDAVEDLGKEGEYFRIGTRRGMSYSATNVVVATGYFDHPTQLGVPGEDLEHVSHYYDEPFKFFGLNVVVVGGRNSAVEAALDIYRGGGHVTLVHRGEELSEGVKYWILPDIENRIRAGQIKARFRSRVKAITRGEVFLECPSGEERLPADFVLILAGFRPDTARLTAYGIGLDPVTLAPVHDPATFETNVSGLFVAGSVVAGKNSNKIFVENGRQHGERIVRAILSRHTGKS